jgi:hypothetical protein
MKEDGRHRASRVLRRITRPPDVVAWLTELTLHCSRATGLTMDGILGVDVAQCAMEESWVDRRTKSTLPAAKSIVSCQQVGYSILC